MLSIKPQSEKPKGDGHVELSEKNTDSDQDDEQENDEEFKQQLLRKLHWLVIPIKKLTE